MTTPIRPSTNSDPGSLPEPSIFSFEDLLPQPRRKSAQEVRQERLDMALWLGIAREDIAEVREALARGADPNAWGQNAEVRINHGEFMWGGRQTCLMSAACRNFVDAVEALLAHPECRPAERQSGTGHTALFCAIHCSAIESLKRLANKDSVRQHATRNDETALGIAIKLNASRDVLEILIPLADWDAVNLQGLNALKIACQEHRWSVIDDLASARPDHPWSLAAWTSEPSVDGFAPSWKWSEKTEPAKRLPRMARIMRARGEAQEIGRAIDFCPKDGAKGEGGSAGESRESGGNSARRI